jgi:hypothetical protein
MLKLRHRYVGALSQGMTPISFSKKLLTLWGGTLNDATPATPLDGAMLKETPANEATAGDKVVNGCENVTSAAKGKTSGNEDVTMAEDGEDGSGEGTGGEGSIDTSD